MASLEAGLVAKEQNKFVLTANGKTAIIVANDDGTPIASNATVFIGTPTLFAVVNTAGTGTQNALTTLNAGPNQIGSVTVSNIISLASINGNVGISGLVSLPSGQLVGLNPGTNYIGLASVNGNINASVASITGQVQLVNGLISLASGQFIGIGANSSLPSINGTFSLTPNTLASIFTRLNDGSQNTAISSAIPAGANFIGLVSTASINGLIQVNNVASLASVYGQFQIVNGLISLASGTVILVNNLVSMASINGLVDVNKITNLASLASIYGLVGLNGNASVIPVYQPLTSNYTSFSTLISASGAASLFAPPNNQRFIVKDLIIGSSGFNEVNIQSGGSVILIPYIGLATLGGYVSNFGESGLRGDALNSAFIINKKSTATISVFANVRFDTT